VTRSTVLSSQLVPGKERATLRDLEGDGSTQKKKVVRGGTASDSNAVHDDLLSGEHGSALILVESDERKGKPWSCSGERDE
jgi:hypothetical protein